MAGPLGGNGRSAGPPGGKRRRLAYIVLAVVILAAVAVLVVFQPQKLFIDDKVDEAVPAGVAPAASNQPPGEGGSFVSRAHSTSGSAIVLSMQDGSRVLRLQDLKTDNGPDLRVYLSAARPDAPESAFNDDFVDLGSLKGNIGSQNYAVAANVDLARYHTVVIWCRRFSVAFGAALLP